MDKLIQEIHENNQALIRKQGKKIPVKFLDCTEHAFRFTDGRYPVCKYCGAVDYDHPDEIDFSGAGEDDEYGR